jgi:nicotinamidase-related amidase
MGPDITRCALIIVDMQNDFLHPEQKVVGANGTIARRFAPTSPHQ